MPKIYIDTNVYLDFYRTSKGDWSIFRDLSVLKRDLLLPQQTIQEIIRNRVSVLRTLQKSILGINDLAFNRSLMLRQLSGFPRWNDAIKSLKDAARDMAEEIDQHINGRSDPCSAEIRELMRSSTWLPTTDSNYNAALKRRSLGQPPTSRNRQWVGDELIWETLLAGKCGDIIIVSRDGDFLDFSHELSVEYKTVTKGSTLQVMDDLAAALKALGAPKTTVEQIQKETSNLDTLPSAAEEACATCGRPTWQMAIEGRPIAFCAHCWTPPPET